MSLPTIVITDGYSADRYIEIGDDNCNLGRLLEAGIIRAATVTDIARLAARKHVSYRHGGHWGSGAYVVETADALYVMNDGFNLGHLELAIRRMQEQQRQDKLDDLYNRIDGVSK